MNLNFLTFDNQLLSQQCLKVSPNYITSIEIQRFIKEFLIFCGYEAKVLPKPKLTRMVGCAAPQVGKMLRIIIVDNTINPLKRNFTQSEFHVLINPKIIWSSQETDRYPESCYSVPLCYCGLIERSTAIVVEAYNKSGKRIRRRYENYTARIVQHEMDHLEGIRFPQKAQSSEEIHLLSFSKREDLLNYRTHWRDWKKHSSKREFLKLKKGQYARI